ncbi:MAG: hypothetical protein A3C02_00025 [Candidatus Andersenbacteria bacterium RIFCSPHIGHO2_02_FULL_45_11]|uniref:DUF4258 domain-containing protein n=1 Tax=Candidatus Andersenbacteria bacterium RIFCSPHIGHO2_12_FULL_45_11 TaxID=1797281 RepID=A0A1G1X2F3_9BACT|nr:MAG: hypothetical protein A2805_01990 [Candidatus Andersenbacteria bacterium RIFCSPHIGHO2_01_FULL_46_36]OGY31945.1 MAG: hypothetical protein A3C02_00025 [Candidatus Andersenbacteria bacterium RIFCSPHIGHO2_02_FULL_45_11]OGY34153.1 MAG: hypothetical protein A3D99_00335 [Candidatus Andersenbacteria bacterium RIFCSPHIGHO2_12_FULL_45_11]QBM02271.1 hypothetical protein [uncultured archaeon]
MRIQFSKHAEFQMQQRDIPKEVVRNVIRKPEKTTHRKDQTLIAQKQVQWHNKNVLCRVIYKREGKAIVKVITTYITTKIDKYNL